MCQRSQPNLSAYPPYEQGGGGAAAVCRKCGGSLAGVMPGAPCPQCGMPSPSAPGVVPGQPGAESATVGPGVACRQCSYVLQGLSKTGQCPECGRPVADSLDAFSLRTAAKTYLDALHSGLSLVLNGILAQIVLTIGLFIAVFAAAAAGAGGRGTLLVQLLGSFGSLAIGIVILLGWWRASEPDPGEAAWEDPTAARKVLRVALAASAGVALLSFLVQGSILLAGPVGALVLFNGGLNLISIAASVTGFFASMIYVSKLAPRIPNMKATRRAKTLMWAMPLLFTVGLLILIGPLIGLVLYWNLLYWVRNDIRRIARGEEPMGGKS